jgi:mRNA-degrading endonuclease toxin of MazEF toxin-antitoxin module
LFQPNGLAWFTLRGQPMPTDVRLNAADGFPAATVCQCDLVYFLDKRRLHSLLGPVTWERQQQIKSKLKEVLRR